MQPLNLIQTILNPNQFINQLALTLRPGQMVNGKVTKLFPNQIAEVLIGANRVIAKLETPLSVNERHWFQVQQGEGKIHLKVLDNKNGTTLNTDSVLKAFSLTNSKENAALLEFFQNKQLPISKEAIHVAAHWLKEKPFAEGLKIIDVVLTKQLPITKNVLNSLYAIVEDEPMSTLIDRLQTILKNNDQPEAAKRLISIIDQLQKPGSKNDAVPNSNQTLHHSKIIMEELKNVIKTIGFSNEYEAFNLLKDKGAIDITKFDALKPQLIRLLNEEVAIPVKEAAEKLLNKITGFQVLSQEAGPIQQLVFQIPLSFWGKNIDVTMQWSGKKTKSGQIDPNYCRILFYLNLEHLKETIVDLHVQNRVITISIINEHDDLRKVALQHTPKLREALEELNYHLSAVHFEKPTDRKLDNARSNKTLPNLKLPNNYNGVDFRI